MKDVIVVENPNIKPCTWSISAFQVITGAVIQSVCILSNEELLYAFK